jgi:hypothetical protein
MPKINFDEIEDVQDFSPIPGGRYLCRLVEVEESKTQYDDEMWNVRFEVIEGEHKGRAVFDRMIFSQAAIKRVKLICSRLGLDVSGPMNLTPEMVKGKTCHLTVQVEEYLDEGQNPKKRNVVPFAGYEKADKAAPAQAPGADSEEEPF